MTDGADLIDISISKYLYEDADRHGNARLYFRKRVPGSKRYRKVRLRQKIGTAEFYEEFAAALAGRPYGEGSNRPSPPPRIVANSLRWLIGEYYKRSTTFKSYDEETKKVRRNLLKALCEEPVVEGNDQQVGDLPYNIPEDKIELLRDRKEGVYAANARLKAIRQLFKWAASTKPVKLLPRNHAADVPLLPEPDSDGHHTWSVEEIQQFIARHPIGTKAHLVLMLFLLTGQRISDVAKLGKQHIRKPENVAPALRKDHPGRWLGFTQYKNRKKAPVHLVIPLLPLLERVLEASPCGSMTFIETEFGKPHSTKGLGNWFADQCVLAGVPGRAHGLRKAGATIAAENGATPYHLMSIFGWKTLEQAELYTKKVRQQLMAGGSMRLIDFDQIVNECDPPQEGVAKSGSLLG